MKLSYETQMTVDRLDMLAILTDAMCGYNVLAGLCTTDVSQTENGDFLITFEPKPEPEAEA